MVLYHCSYKNCNLGCKNISQHNARYAKIKSQKEYKSTKEPKKIKKSPRINYNILKKLKAII